MMLPSGFLTTHPPLAAAAAASAALLLVAVLRRLLRLLPLLPLPLLLSTGSMSKLFVAEVARVRPAEEGAPRWCWCCWWWWFGCMSSAFKARLMCPSFIPAL